MGEPKKKPASNPISQGYEQVKKAYKQGATDANETFASHAGKELKAGRGKTMAIYRTNKQGIQELDD